MVTPPLLRPTLPDSVQLLCDAPEQLFSVAQYAKGPIALHFPEIASRNARQFQQELDAIGVRARVFAAHKATGSFDIIANLRDVCGVDVASSAELASARKAGFLASDLIATGPKPTQFLADLAVLGIPIIVDSPEELERLQTVATDNVEVLLRLSRTMINADTVTKRSRFGMDAKSFASALTLLAHMPHVKLRGVAFHLDSQSVVERVTAVRRGMGHLLTLQNNFPAANVLDIGGGYGTHYGVSKYDTDVFEATLRQAVQTGDLSSLTWQGHGYGLSNAHGHVTGTLHGFDISAEPYGIERLRETLLATDVSGYTLAAELADNLVEVWLEPGAALYADAGALAAEIMEVRELDGDTIVIVDAHRNQVCFENNEVLADPILIRNTTHSATLTDCFIAGHLCAENDFLTYRKIHFDHRPQAGDILLWSHAGAYRMHFSASQAIGHSLAKQYTYQPEARGYTLVESTQ